MYTYNEISETEISKKVPFDRAASKKNYLGINLTKEVKGLYSEKCTTLKKEIKEYKNKWKHIPSSWIRTIYIIKMSILPKTMYNSTKSLLKYQ